MSAADERPPVLDRILMTGANGFVGRYVAAGLAARYPHAEVTACTAARSQPAVRNEAVADLRDQHEVDRLVAASRPGLVIHLAAQSSVARSAAEADLTWSVNLAGALNVALAVARHVPQSTVLFASTAEVYGASFLQGAVLEATPLAPMNPYAKSKALAERMFAEVLPATTRLIVVRPSNHTGAGQHEQFVLPGFAAQIARIEAGMQEPRVAVGNLDVRRDFLDVRDVVRAYLALIDRSPMLPFRFTVNVSSGSPHLLRDLVERLRRLSQKPFEIAVDPARLRPVDLQVALADPTLLKAVTGWTPTVGIDDTLRDVLQAARDDCARRGH